MNEEVSDKLEEDNIAEPLILCKNQYYKIYFPNIKISEKCMYCSSDEINPGCENYIQQEVYDFNRQQFLSLSQFALR